MNLLNRLIKSHPEELFEKIFRSITLTDERDIYEPLYKIHVPPGKKIDLFPELAIRFRNSLFII